MLSYRHKPDTAAELGLCAKLLAADERNFHCWAFRRFVAKTLNGESAAASLAFARAKIDANFSNYSAWHARAAALLQLQGEAGGGGGGGASGGAGEGASGEASGVLRLGALRDEFSLVANALFTEPEDQAGWFYHAWLVSCAPKAAALEAAAAAPPPPPPPPPSAERSAERCEAPAAAAAAWAHAAALLSEQADACRELAASEPQCRWPRVALVGLLPALDACSRGGQGGGGGGGGGASGGAGGEDEALPGAAWRREAAVLLRGLQVADPMRRGMYEDQLAGVERGGGAGGDEERAVS